MLSSFAKKVVVRAFFKMFSNLNNFTIKKDKIDTSVLKNTNIFFQISDILNRSCKMTSSIGYINAFSYSSNMVSSGASGKLYVPVNRSAILYSNFDHVSGVVAKSGQQGVSISKIRILNTLIDRLSAIKNQPKESISDISDDKADALIENYQKQIQQAAQNPYILNGAQPMAGSLFQIDA